MVASREARTLEELAFWLSEYCGVSPDRYCNGVGAPRALKRKIWEDFGVNHVVVLGGNLHSLFTGELILHRDDAENYLWGVEVTLECA